MKSWYPRMPRGPTARRSGHRGKLARVRGGAAGQSSLVFPFTAVSLVFPFTAVSRVCQGPDAVCSEPALRRLCLHPEQREVWGRVCRVGCQAQRSQLVRPPLAVQSPFRADPDRPLRVGQAGAPAPTAVVCFSPASRVCSPHRAGLARFGGLLCLGCFLEGLELVLHQELNVSTN